MADTKISALPAAASLGDTDELVLNVAGANQKLTGANLKASLPASAITLLSTTTLASPGTFDVSGISGAYNDLIIVLIGRTADASANDGAGVRFNNDSAGNYYRQRLQASASTPVALETLGQVALYTPNLCGNGATAGHFGVVEMIVFGYASTTWRKNVLMQTFGPASVATGNLLWAGEGGIWASTAAINRVQVLGANTANFVAGSKLRIYGRA